jgi:hypothetical protein
MGLLQDLVEDAFKDRVVLAFATVAYAVATAAPDPNNPTPTDVRKAQLAAVRFLADDPAKARQLADRSLLLIAGAPEVQAAAADVSQVTQADLVKIAGKIMKAYGEYAQLGGSL